MVESCPKDSPGQQSLLEAAKALVGTLAWSTHWAKANLIDAIAREEVKQASLQDDAGRYAYWKSKATRYESERDTCYSDHQKEAARAQQAESSAAWWKSEGERLSAELAKMRSATDRPSSFHTYLSEIRAELQSDDSHATVAAAKAMRERAEKAEAEAARWKARANDAETAVAAHCGALPQFEGDPKACAFPHGAFSNAGPSHDLNPFADVDQLAKDASDLLSSDMGRVLARMVIEAAKKEAK